MWQIGGDKSIGEILFRPENIKLERDFYDFAHGYGYWGDKQ